MSDETRSNTTANSEDKPKRGRPFAKGDPRINRKGRPKSFDALRRLTQQIATEIITAKDGSLAMSRVELILREWSTSKDPRKQQAFIEIAYGKVPNPVEVSGKDGKDMVVKVVYVRRDGNSAGTSGSSPEPETGKE